MKTSCLAMIAAIGVLTASAAAAAQFVYPAKGQDQATQAKDESECSTWATQQTGFRPGDAMATSSPLGALTGTPTDTSAITSAIGAGAAGVGGTAGTAGALMGQGGVSPAASALGAVPAGGMGGAAGALGTVGQMGAANQVAGMVGQATGVAPQKTTGRADYDRARTACLTGRGYSVQ